MVPFRLRVNRDIISTYASLTRTSKVSHVLTPTNNSPIRARTASSSTRSSTVLQPTAPPPVLVDPQSCSGSRAAHSGWLGTPPGERRARTSNARRCASRRGAAACAVGALSGAHSGSSRLRTGCRRCGLEAAATAGSPRFPSSSLPPVRF